MKECKKALAFTKDKWNLKTNSPIESGTTVDDVIEHVRRRMCLSKFITIDDDNDEVNGSASAIDIAVDVARGSGGVINDDDDDDSDDDDDANENDKDVDKKKKFEER